MTDFRFSGGRKTNGPFIHALYINLRHENIQLNKIKYYEYQKSVVFLVVYRCCRGNKTLVKAVRSAHWNFEGSIPA